MRRKNNVGAGSVSARKENGITLIALIITIIIMLILVGVTIQVVINSNLIGIAQNAANRTETAYQEESTTGEVTINGKTYENIDDYFAGIEKIEEVHDWQYTDNTMASVKCICDECKEVDAEGQTLSIGQEVAYTNAGDIEWVIFGVEDKNKNGTNESLLITTLNVSSEELTLEGADAYNNGIAEINALCKELYGEEARGMTIEDVNNTLGYTPTGGMYYDKLDKYYYVLDGFDTQLNTTDIWENFKLNHDANYGELYYTPDYPEGTLDENVIGNLKINGYEYAADADVATDEGTGFPNVPETTSKIVIGLVFGNSGGYEYWLASRGEFIDTGSVAFGPSYIKEGIVHCAENCMTSGNPGWERYYYVRPIVSFISEIPEVGEIVVSEWEGVELGPQ